MDLSVIIIHFRMGEKLKVCLESMMANGWDKKYEILVVHKASEEPGDEVLKEFPFIRVIPYDRFGVGEMRNVGIRNSTGRYVLMFDADAWIKEDRFDDALSYMDNHSEAAVMGMKLLNKDNTLQYSCRSFYTLWTILLRRAFLGKIFKNGALRCHLMLDWDHASPREVDWVVGACLMIRKEALEKIGYFQEITSFGFEDVDFCWRARNMGFKTVYYPYAQVYHEYQRSSAKISLRMKEHTVAAISFYYHNFMRKK